MKISTLLYVSFRIIGMLIFGFSIFLVAMDISGPLIL